MSGFQLAPLAALLLAHLAGEGMLVSMASGRPRASQHVLVLLVHTVLALFAIWFTLGWSLPVAAYAVFIGVMHVVGRMLKRPAGESGAYLHWLEQSMQALLLVAVWLSLTNQWDILPLVLKFFTDEQVLLLLLAYVVVIWPLSGVIGWICRPWADIAADANSLPRAGAWIGMLERVLILTFILIDEFAAIGFLLAAKSILRFGGAQEKDHRKLTEYVLIGTLASFTATIIFGILVRRLVLGL